MSSNEVTEIDSAPKMPKKVVAMLVAGQGEVDRAKPGQGERRRKKSFTVPVAVQLWVPSAGRIGHSIYGPWKQP